MGCDIKHVCPKCGSDNTSADGMCPKCGHIDRLTLKIVPEQVTHDIGLLGYIREPREGNSTPMSEPIPKGEKLFGDMLAKMSRDIKQARAWRYLIEAKALADDTRAGQCSIAVCTSGVRITTHTGDEGAVCKVVSWEALELAEINPLIECINASPVWVKRACPRCGHTEGLKEDWDGDICCPQCGYAGVDTEFNVSPEPEATPEQKVKLTCPYCGNTEDFAENCEGDVTCSKCGYVGVGTDFTGESTPNFE